MTDESKGPAPGEDIVRWVYSSTSPAQLAARYDFWAANYELDTERDYGRNDPKMTVPLVQKYVPQGARILDAGVGTGLVGQLMADAGYDDLTGIEGDVRPERGVIIVHQEYPCPPDPLVFTFHKIQIPHIFCSSTREELFPRR